jgi:hypothetical protein
MKPTLLAQHNDFCVELDEYGIAHLVLGQPGAMPATGPEGHAEIGQLWRILAENRDVRCILIRSRLRWPQCPVREHAPQAAQREGSLMCRNAV